MPTRRSGSRALGREKKAAGVVEENTEQVTKRNIIASAT